MKVECLFYFNDRSGLWGITCAERCCFSREGEQLWRYINAPAPAMLLWGLPITETPCVRLNTCRYTSMRTGWTAVFAQSNLADDLPDRGPAQFFVNSYPPWLQTSSCRFIWRRSSSYLGQDWSFIGKRSSSPAPSYLNYSQQVGAYPNKSWRICEVLGGVCQKGKQS